MTDTIFFIQQNKQWGIISFSKQMIVLPKYDLIYHIWGGQVFGVQEGNKRGIIWPSKDIFTPVIYEQVVNNETADGFLVQLNNKWGVLLEDLQTLILIDRPFYKTYKTMPYLKLIGITDKQDKFLGYVGFNGIKYWD